MSKLIWMSDPHVRAAGPVLGYDTVARLEAAVAHINAHHSDAEYCVISGDLAEEGSAADYAVVAGCLSRLVVPVLPMVGNHDVRDPLQAALDLPGDAMAAFVQYRVTTPDAVVICLDTLDAGHDDGAFCADRLRWLEAALHVEDARPVCLFMHHPPIRLGLGVLDPDNLDWGARLLDLIARSPRTAHLFMGHVHRPVSGVARGIPFAAMRAVSYQAPPPRPVWDWDSFAPAHEAPMLGVIDIQAEQITVQFEAFCSAAVGWSG